MIEKLTGELNQKTTECSENTKAIYIRERETEKDRAIFIQKEKKMANEVIHVEQKFEESQKKIKNLQRKFEIEKNEIIAKL